MCVRPNPDRRGGLRGHADERPCQVTTLYDAHGHQRRRVLQTGQGGAREPRLTLGGQRRRTRQPSQNAEGEAKDGESLKRSLQKQKKSNPDPDKGNLRIRGNVLLKETFHFTFTLQTVG